MMRKILGVLIALCFLAAPSMAQQPVVQTDSIGRPLSTPNVGSTGPALAVVTGLQAATEIDTWTSATAVNTTTGAWGTGQSTSGSLSAVYFSIDLQSGSGFTGGVLTFEADADNQSSSLWTRSRCWTVGGRVNNMMSGFVDSIDLASNNGNQILVECASGRATYVRMKLAVGIAGSGTANIRVSGSTEMSMGLLSTAFAGTGTRGGFFNSSSLLNATVAIQTQSLTSVTAVLQVSNAITAGAVTFEVANRVDPNNSIASATLWVPARCTDVDNLTLSPISVASLIHATNDLAAWRCDTAGFEMFRVRLSTTITSAGGGNALFDLTAVNAPAPTVLALEPNRHSVSLSFNESVAAPTAATWYQRIKWTPPTSSVFRPDQTKSVVTTAGSRTAILVGIKMGSLDLSTNTFTDGSAVAAPNHYSRLFGCVSTVMSAVADNITVTYTDELGNTGNATTALTFAASSPVGNCFEFQLAATTGQMRDAGVRDVTNITDSAAPTGVVDIWAFNVLHDALGVANAFEFGGFDNTVIDSTETIMILLQQAATTAQQRGASLEGSIEN